MRYGYAEAREVICDPETWHCKPGSRAKRSAASTEITRECIGENTRSRD
jgi:hypothetical protein